MYAHTRDAHKWANKTRDPHKEPTGYSDQAPAMNWDHAVSWGRGVWVSVSDSVRVGLANRN